MIRASVFPTMGDGRSGDLIAEIERPTATDAIAAVAIYGSAAIGLAMQHDAEVIGLSIEVAEVDHA